MSTRAEISTIAMPDPPRFAAFDLDGTVLDGEGRVFEGMDDAFCHLRDLGMVILLVTGRSAIGFLHAELPADISDQCERGILVDDGDSRLDRLTGAVHSVAVLPPDAAAELADSVAHSVAVAGGRLFASTRRAAAAYAMAYRLPRDLIEIAPPNGPVSRIIAFDAAPVRLRDVTTTAIEPFRANVYAPGNGGKASGLTRLLADHYGERDLRAVLGFGDGDNDAELLAACGAGVAAPAASAAAKAAAGYLARPTLAEFILATRLFETGAA